MEIAEIILLMELFVAKHVQNMALSSEGFSISLLWLQNFQSAQKAQVRSLMYLPNDALQNVRDCLNSEHGFKTQKTLQGVN